MKIYPNDGESKSKEIRVTEATVLEFLIPEDIEPNLLTTYMKRVKATTCNKYSWIPVEVEDCSGAGSPVDGVVPLSVIIDVPGNYFIKFSTLDGADLTDPTYFDDISVYSENISATASSNIKSSQISCALISGSSGISGCTEICEGSISGLTNPITSKIDEVITAINNTSDADDTDDDIRPSTIQCYKLANGSDFTGYAKINEDGSFNSWGVIEGTVPTQTNPVVGLCKPETLEFVEVQNRVFGFDNDPPHWNRTLTLELELSDGRLVTFEQTPQGNFTGQLLQWQANVSQLAIDLGLPWVVEAQYNNSSDPNDLSGKFGLPGNDSVAISTEFIAAGVVARHLVVKSPIGSVYPVKVQVIASSNSSDPIPFVLRQAGPILGPITKYKRCTTCDGGVSWFFEDGTPVPTGREPKAFYDTGGALLTSLVNDILIGQNVRQTTTFNSVAQSDGTVSFGDSARGYSAVLVNNGSDPTPAGAAGTITSPSSSGPINVPVGYRFSVDADGNGNMEEFSVSVTSSLPGIEWIVTEHY